MKELNKTQLTMVSGAGTQDFFEKIEQLKDLGSNWNESTIHNNLVSFASEVMNSVSSLAQYVLSGRDLFNSISNTFNKYLQKF